MSKRSGSMKQLDLPKGYKSASFVRVRENGLIAKAIVDGGLAWEFKFQDIPGYTDFTALYDAYIIDRVDVTFWLAKSDGNYPEVFTAPDYDGDGVPALSGDVTQKEGVTFTPLSLSKNKHVISITPRTSGAIYRAGVTSAYGWSPSNQLIDMNNVDVPYYGAASWIANYNSTSTPFVAVYSTITYHFRCVGQR